MLIFTIQCMPRVKYVKFRDEIQNFNGVSSLYYITLVKGFFLTVIKYTIYLNVKYKCYIPTVIMVANEFI